jgi:hypothetical protein
MKASLDKIFHNVVYIISPTRVILKKLDDFFVVVYTDFHEGCRFLHICPPPNRGPYFHLLMNSISEYDE